MDIVTYHDIEDTDMAEMTLACFDHPYSKEHVKGMVQADSRLPGWGGELYAVDGEKVLGTCGVLYPRAKFGSTIKRVAGIRNVCVRPSKAGAGVATRLLEEAHNKIREEGLEHSFLMTSKGLVAHSLYKKLGYRDVYVYPAAFKYISKSDTQVEFQECEDFSRVRKLYMDSVQGLEGLVVREDDYHVMAEARGWPDNDDLHLATIEGERIGYAMFKKGRKSLVCNELAAERGELQRLITGLEQKAEGCFLVLKFVNPKYEDTLKKMGFKYSTDRWGVVMKKSFDDSKLEGLFHNGIYESF